MWKLAATEHETFKRNALQTVVFQLRFHPILKVAARVAEFQDRVRGAFPQFQEIHGQQVDMQLPSGAVPAFRVRQEASYQFRTTDNQTIVDLGSAAVAVTELQHESRDALFSAVAIALRALDEEFSPISGTRIGLRYVNLIDRDAIADDLGKPVQWSDLITPEFLRLPMAAVDESTVFYSEVNAPREPGAMTVRSALLRGPTQKTTFRLDVDRYFEGPSTLEDIPERLAPFASDIFSVFRACAGPALVEWARGGDGA